MAANGGRWPAVRQLARYALVGGLTTALNVGLYLLLRTWWDQLPATLSAVVVCTVASTELNRRFTFAAARTAPWRRHVQTAGAAAFYVGYSSLALGALDSLVSAPTPVQESAALAAAGLLGGLGRFLLLRHWVFADAGRGHLGVRWSLPARPALTGGRPLG